MLKFFKSPCTIPSNTHTQRQAVGISGACVISFWILVWACCFQACRPVPQKKLGTDECLVPPLDFEYLKIGTTIGYRDHTHHYSSAHVHFRIKKDSLIWFSVLAPWGIEIMRGIITPTGITLLNRTQKVCYIHDYATLRAFWPGPWDYALLQALLLGELARAATPHEIIAQNAQHTVIQQQKGAWTLTHFINPLLGKVEKIIATAIQGSFLISYNQFKPCQGGLFFRRATLSWYDRTTPVQAALTLTLKGTKVQWPTKPLRFPFSIPAQYEKKQAILDF